MTCLASAYNRQGIRLESDEDWAKYEQHKAARRYQNVVNAREVLHRNRIIFEELGADGEKGQKFNVRYAGWPVSARSLPFWPEVGQWIDQNGMLHFGVRNLARYITSNPEA